MKHWRKTSGVRIGRVVSSFSVLLSAAIALGGPYSDADSALKRSGSDANERAILTALAAHDPELNRYLEEARGPNGLHPAEGYVALRAFIEHAAPADDPSVQIRQIKASGLYHDEGLKEQANWLSGAVERLKNLIPKFDPPKTQGPSAAGLGGLAQLLVYMVWFVLGAGIIAFIVYVLSFVRLNKNRKRKAKALLEDSEPERSLDEWLMLADAYQGEARYREAVRALYLACLLKFDEANIARFRREQTNWEHLARIDASARKPATIDFRPPTQAFDRIWYGHQVRGPQDVDNFREWYAQVRDALLAVAA